MTAELPSPAPPPQLTETELRYRAPWYLARRSRPYISKRSLVPVRLSKYVTAFARAADAALPWTLRTYPGFRKGVVAIFGGRASWDTIAHWRSGRRDPPDWAREVIADYLRGRAAAMLEAADALNEVARRREGRTVAATRARKAKRRAKAREV